jgi:hypothetical protein
MDLIELLLKLKKGDTNIFGVGISMEESSCAVATRKLFLV